MNFIIHAYSVRRVYVYMRRWGGNGIKNPGRREDEFFSKDARFRGNYNYVLNNTAVFFDLFIFTKRRDWSIWKINGGDLLKDVAGIQNDRSIKKYSSTEDTLILFYKQRSNFQPLENCQILEVVA